MHEYWERFKKLCASCPHHQISDQLLIQYFCEGLTSMDKCMVDAASGGALVDKTPVVAREFITKLFQNAHRFCAKMSAPTHSVNEIRTPMDQQRIKNKIEELASMVRAKDINHHHLLFQFVAFAP